MYYRGTALMAFYFFDSSALAKYYVSEIGSAWVESIIDAHPPNQIALAQITGVEIVAALARRVRSGMVVAATAAAAMTVFRYDFGRRFFILPISPQLIAAAMNLAELHRLRAYDATQLAAVAEVQAQMSVNGMGPLTLISADLELNQAAQAEGLLTDAPNQHP
jgi:uncharacterized protein